MSSTASSRRRTWRSATTDANTMTTSSPAVCRWSLIAATSAAAAIMVVLVLVSTIDVTYATTGGWGRSRSLNKSNRKGWNIENVIRGGSTTIVQQQSPPPPPPPPRPVEVVQDDGQNLHHHHQKSPHHLKPSDEKPAQQQYPTSPDDYHPDDRRSTSRGDPKNLSSVLPKKIDLKQVTQALLRTSETNEKLLQGVNHWGRHKSSQLVTATSSPSMSHQSKIPHSNQQQYITDHYNLRQNEYGVYGTVPVNVHPSRAWKPSIRAFSGRIFEDEELTLFHAKIPRSRSSSEADESGGGETDNSEKADTDIADSEAESQEGALYWGPDLLPYLEHILYELIGVDREGSEIFLVLAMIYLDRACSVETPRTAYHQQTGGGVVPPCPFCAPRTVHRLSLSALVIAVKALRRTTSASMSLSSQQIHPSGGHSDPYNSDAALLEKLSRSLGIPLLQLQQMVEWMLLSLGDDGLYVSMEELRAFRRSWESFIASEEQMNGIKSKSK